jgi:WD40 repeat protein
MKNLTLVFVFLSFWMNAFAQSGLRFNIKIKPGSSVKYLSDNDNIAISSGKELLIAKASSGVASKKLLGHKGSINDINTSVDGKYALTASSDKSIILWDVANGIQKKQFYGHQKSVTKVVFIGNEKLASISDDQTLKIWDIESATQLNSFSDHSKTIKSLAVSKDLLATGGADNMIVLRNIDSGELVRKINTGDSGIRSLIFSGDGAMVISGLSNGLIKTWNTESGQLESEINNGKGKINNISLAKDNKHIAVSGASCKIYNLDKKELVSDYDKVSSIVLDASFSPDGKSLVMIEELVPKASVWDISQLNITQAYRITDKSDKIPPQIFISKPIKIVDNRVTHYQDLISIKGSVIDDSGVRSLKINGTKTPIKANGNFVIMLPLSMGDNFVSIEVADINDNTSLKKFIVSRKNLDGEKYVAEDAKNYLLVIGINKYEKWPQLYNATKDANDVVNTLLSAYNFNYADVKLITDENATRSNIYNTLRDYVNQVGPQDNFMIYYSGHGHFDELLNEGYWIPVDARVNTNGDYLSNSDISKIISSINSQHTFLVADACFSGSLFNEQSRGYVENVEKFRSRWGLASGRLETVSDGQAGKNSPFAESFIRYLKESEKDKISVSEIVQFVKIQVAEISNQTPIGNPLKGVGDEGGEFIFYKRK